MCSEVENPPQLAQWFDDGRKCIYCGHAIKQGQMIHVWNDEEPNHHLERDCPSANGTVLELHHPEYVTQS